MPVPIDAVSCHDPCAAIDCEASPAGAQAAIDALVEQHRPLARRIAATLYANRHVEEHAFDDFHQLALVGLVESARRYDPSTSVPFEAFAAARVRGAVLNGVRSLSERQEQVAMRARIARERAESLRAGEEATPDLFDLLVSRTVGLAIGHMLEDSGMYCDSERGVPECGYERVELRQLVQRVVECVELLPERERRLVRGHYLQGELFDTLAAEFGVSKGRVSQMHKQAIERLRGLCAERGMRDIRL